MEEIRENSPHKLEEKIEVEEKNSTLKCVHCFKILSKRRILSHQTNCPASKLPEVNKLITKTENGRTTYSCECGYTSRRDRVFKHVSTCSRGKDLESTKYASSFYELEEYRQNGSISPLPAEEFAPIICSLDETVKIENEEDRYFDENIHPRFHEFRQPKDDAPIPTIEDRYRIFAISLLLRLTGSFMPGVNMWLGSRCKNINTSRFLTQINSHASIFKNKPRTFAHIEEYLKDVAYVTEDFISVINHEGLMHQLKEAIENHRHTPIWHYAHIAQLVERKKKRAPRAHWETRKMRKYIANVRYRNKKWGSKIRPLTLLQLRERCGYVEELDQMYLMRYYMTRPMPKYHRKKLIEKKDKLMVQYAIHRIADAFTASFYLDYICFEMKVADSNSEEMHTVNIFESKKQHDDWKQKMTKQLPTTTVWLAVSRYYLKNRKEAMKEIYLRCQDRFRRPMPEKSQEEIFSLVVKWYESKFLIDSDDWPEIKNSIQEGYEEKIKEEVDRIKFPAYDINEEKIDEMEPEKEPEELMELRIALQKPHQREFIPKCDVSLFKPEQIFDKTSIFLPKDREKNFDVMDFQRCCKSYCESWLNGCVLDCPRCHATYHSYCWPKNDLCEVCLLHNDSLGYQEDLPASVKEIFHLFPTMKKMLTQPAEILYGEEEARKNIEKNLQKQQYCVYNVFHECFTLYPFYNNNLKQLDTTDEEIINKYASEEMAFPVIVKEMNSIKGKGLVARRPILKGELVSTYSGNVMALSQVAKYGDKKTNEYTFDLIYGPNVQTNFVVYPKDYASAGFFMNHSTKKNNVETLVVLTKKGPLILMIAKKNIAYGNELLYNYNGYSNMYKTDGFI